MDIRLDKYKDRVRILAWAPASYDHDDGYFEIAHIKLSKSKNSFMDDWDLDEILASLKVKNHAEDLLTRYRK